MSYYLLFIIYYLLFYCFIVLLFYCFIVFMLAGLGRIGKVRFFVHRESTFGFFIVWKTDLRRGRVGVISFALTIFVCCGKLVVHRFLVGQ